MEDQYIKSLLSHGVKPTANRIIIARQLDAEGRPMSMKELEYSILTLDKSSIFRTLMLFKEQHLVHIIEDGDGGVKYELCLSQDEHNDEDEHVHFFCERCHKTTCLHDIPMPKMDCPSGYELHSTNVILRGICPKCLKKA